MLIGNDVLMISRFWSFGVNDFFMIFKRFFNMLLPFTKKFKVSKFFVWNFRILTVCFCIFILAQ